jgi:hypothetical protein
MFLSVVACEDGTWVEDSIIELENTGNLIADVIKELRRLKKARCDKYIVYNHIDGNFIVVDFIEEKTSFKIVTENEVR